MSSLRNRMIRGFTDLHVAVIRSTHWKLGARLGSKPMTARTASDDEKAQIWPKVIAKAKNFEGYQVKTTRNIPVVILEPRA